MDCSQNDKDLVSLNQKLFLGLNPSQDLKRKSRYKKRSGWKAYDTKSDNVKNRLTAENMVRKDKKKRLDFTNKALNPTVYPNFDASEIGELSSKRSRPAFSESDPVFQSIERDNVLDERQIERQELFTPILETKKGTNPAFSAFGRQKYFIAQVRNYLPLVKNPGVREKLRLFLKYLQTDPSAKELIINERGHVQRGFFDTQTKFSDYLSYYVLPSEEKLHAKKPPFYNVIIAEPLTEYLASNRQQNALDKTDIRNVPEAVSTFPKVEKRLDGEREDSEEITPLRNIKDSDLRLETSLPKMINLLTSLNIDMTSGIDENDYEKLINVTAFPIYATNPSRDAVPLKEKEFANFVGLLKSLLVSEKEGTGTDEPET